MITFWVNAAGRFGMDQYRATRAEHLAGRIQVRLYEDLAPALEAGTGGHIFAALDQLSPGGLDAAAALHDGLSKQVPEGLLLNHPRMVPRRSALLRKLSEAGVNGFGACSALDAAGVERFPVFLREDVGHNGPLTGLLDGPKALARALRALRARGYRPGDLLVVEYCDLSNAQGVFRTASAFRVGAYIVPAHLLKGRHWMLKWTGSDHGEEAMREHLEYVLTNPHEAWVRRIFELAGVDYGRLDYGFRGETLQAWEINTNPTLGPSRTPEPGFAPEIDALLLRARVAHHDALRAAFGLLDRGSDSERVTVRIEPALIARMHAESKREERHRGVLDLLRRVYSYPGIGRVLQAAYQRLLPRL